MDTLKTLLGFYIVLLTLNTIVSSILWLIYRTRPFLALLGLWLFTLINFVLQGISLETNILSVLCFSTYFPAAWCLTLVLQSVSNFNIDFRPYVAAYSASIILAIILSFVTSTFWVLSLPVALAISIPQVHSAIKKIFQDKKSGPALSNIFAIILLLNGIHFLDYPFLREHEVASVIGFGLVIVFSTLFTALLPAIVSTHHVMHLKEKTELAEARSEFLSIIGHEVLSPIAGVINMVELVKQDKLTNDQQRYCEHIEACALNLMNITTNILSSSEMESTSIAVQSDRFSLFYLASEITDHYTAKAKHLPIEVTCTVIDPMPPYLCSDEGKIRQIIYNLVDNSLKHSHGSEVDVKIRYQDGHLNVVVSDNGVGMSQDDLERIFTRFEKSKKGLGLGLGLSIVKGLLTSLSGDITVESELGKGSRFSFMLPAATGSSK